MPANSHLLEEAWQKYSGMAPRGNEEKELRFPGKVFGKEPGKGDSAFNYPWKYRSGAFELHYENPEKLARSIHSLAVFTRDASPDLPKEKFYGGVLGFHYSARQIADWLNDALAEQKQLDFAEGAFAGLLLEHGVIRLDKGRFEPGGEITHVLGAAPGRKRSFDRNLRHERLHVFWDEDRDFQEREKENWRQMSEEERARARGELKNYSQDNESQLVEEWAIKPAENSDMPIR